MTPPRGGAGTRLEVGPFGRRLLLVALVGLALRVAVVVAIPTRPTSDSWSYFERGVNVLRHGEYAPFPGKPDASYPPGYSLALATAIALAPAGKALLFSRLLSCGLAFCSVLLAGLLGRRLFGPATGLAAAALLALFPRHVLQATVLLSEHLFLPPLLLLVTIVVAAWDRPVAWRLAALAGVTTGLLALVRPIGYLLGFLWMGQVLARRRKGPTLLAEMALLLAVQHAVMLPWAVRNHVTLGSFSFVSSVGGVDLLIGNNPRATGGFMAWRPVLEELDPAARGAVDVDRLARRAALRWMRENPAEALRLYVRKLGLILGRDDFLVFFALTGRGLWPPLGGADALPPGHPAIALAPAIQALLDWSDRALLALAALGGLATVHRLLRKEPGASAAALLPLAAAAYFPLVAAVFLAASRFRWPAEELLVVPAAWALTLLAALLPLARRRAEG